MPCSVATTCRCGVIRATAGPSCLSPGAALVLSMVGNCDSIGVGCEDDARWRDNDCAASCCDGDCCAASCCEGDCCAASCCEGDCCAASCCEGDCARSDDDGGALRSIAGSPLGAGEVHDGLRPPGVVSPAGGGCDNRDGLRAPGVVSPAGGGCDNRDG